MTISEILAVYPEAEPVLSKWGFHCISCPLAAMESLEQGAMAHGLNDGDLKKLISEIEALEKK